MSDIARPQGPEIQELVKAMGLERVTDLTFSVSVDKIPMVTVTRYATVEDMAALTQVFKLTKLVEFDDESEDTRPG